MISRVDAGETATEVADQPEKASSGNDHESIVRPNDVSHDANDDYSEKIKERYQELVEKARAESPNASDSAISERAWELSYIDRQSDEHSTDSLARDVEHYALCRFAATSNNILLESSCSVGFVYDAVKSLALGAKRLGFPGLERALRTDTDRPISEPGWRVDYWRGLIDGWTNEEPRRSHSVNSLP